MGKADSWMTVQREDDSVTPKGLWLEARARENMKMRSVAAVVDSDWDITYYNIRTSLEGFHDDGPIMDSRISSWNVRRFVRRFNSLMNQSVSMNCSGVAKFAGLLNCLARE